MTEQYVKISRRKEVKWGDVETGVDDMKKWRETEGIGSTPPVQAKPIRLDRLKFLLLSITLILLLYYL